jgi:hypothetical protein
MVKPVDTAAAARMPTDSVNEFEQRISSFLEEEQVRNIMLQDYLKALSSYTEIVKYQGRPDPVETKTPLAAAALASFQKTT